MVPTNKENYEVHCDLSKADLAFSCTSDCSMCVECVCVV